MTNKWNKAVNMGLNTFFFMVDVMQLLRRVVDQLCVNQVLLDVL